MLDFHRLQLLHKFATLGSISAVANHSGYSPSAVSQQLKTLEREAGVALLERTAYSAALTRAGHELVRHAGVILGDVERAESHIRASARTVGGTVIISCIPGLAATVAPELARVQREYPDLHVVMRETTSVQAKSAVLDRLVDIAVIDEWAPEADARSSGLSVDCLRTEGVGLVFPARHSLGARTTPITPGMLRAAAETETWLCAPPGHLSREASDRRLAEIAVEPTRRWEFEGLAVLAAVIASGAGIALLPASVAHAQRGVGYRPLSPRLTRRLLVVRRNSRDVDPAATICLATIRGAV